MSRSHRAEVLGRRLFGAIKRPLFDATLALTGVRLGGTAEYFDFGMFGGRFEARVDDVDRRLPPGFDVIESKPGRTELEVWCADYRRMDILRPYRELAVMAPVRLVRSGRPTIEGMFTMQMTVTTEEARWTGVEVHGFPKIVADVDFRYDDDVVRCSCHHRGVRVLTLYVDVRKAEPFEDRVQLLNARHDGELIRTAFERAGEIANGAGGVVLDLGDHYIADELRSMGIRPLTGNSIYLPTAHGVLRRPEELGPLPVTVEAVHHPSRPAPAPRTAVHAHVR